MVWQTECHQRLPSRCRIYSALAAGQPAPGQPRPGGGEAPLLRTPAHILVTRPAAPVPEHVTPAQPLQWQSLRPAQPP
jgi:hypothetical protein